MMWINLKISEKKTCGKKRREYKTSDKKPRLTTKDMCKRKRIKKRHELERGI